MPDLLDFLLYCFYNSNFKADNLGGKRSTAHLCNMGISLLEYFRKHLPAANWNAAHISLPPARIQDLAVDGEGIRFPRQPDRRGLVPDR